MESCGKWYAYSFSCICTCLQGFVDYQNVFSIQVLRGAEERISFCMSSCNQDFLGTVEVNTSIQGLEDSCLCLYLYELFILLRS